MWWYQPLFPDYQAVWSKFDSNGQRAGNKVFGRIIGSFECCVRNERNATWRHQLHIAPYLWWQIDAFHVPLGRRMMLVTRIQQGQRSQHVCWRAETFGVYVCSINFIGCGWGRWRECCQYRVRCVHSTLILWRWRWGIRCMMCGWQVKGTQEWTFDLDGKIRRKYQVYRSVVLNPPIDYLLTREISL